MSLLIRRWIAVAVLLAGGGLLRGARADDAAAPPTAADVAPWASQLGSGRLADRQAAEHELLRRGPAILPLLPEFERLTDPAVRDAVRRIREQLELQLASESLQATRVTWRGSGALSEIAAQIESQTGNAVDVSTLSAEARAAWLDINWNDVAFWDAVGQLADRLGLQITMESTTPPLQRVSLRAPEAEGPAWRPLAAVTSGPFRLEVTAVTQRAGFTAPGGEALWRIDLRWLAEPRLRPLYVELRDREIVVQAGDDRWQAFNPNATRQADFNATGAAEASLDYLWAGPSTPAKLTISGPFAVELAAVPQELEFRPLTGPFPIIRRRGGTVAILGGVRKETVRAADDAGGPVRRAVVRILLRYPVGGPAFESHRLATWHRGASWRGPDGERMAVNDGQELTLEQDGAIAVEYRFRGIPENWDAGTLLYEAPLALRRTSQDFQLTIGAQPDAQRD